MGELLKIGIFPIILTLGAYQVGLLLQKKLKSPLCNPVLLAVILVLVFLSVTGLDIQGYQQGNGILSWLMTPATVCLAVPMYQQYQVLKKNLKAIALGVGVGAITCLVVILGIALVTGLDRSLVISLLPKSVTTAIGVPLSELSGGIGSITTAAIIVTGIGANVLSTYLIKLFGITDRIAQGVALGTAGHVIGTARANEIDPLTGAVSSLSLVVAGLLTTIVFPVLVMLF